MKWLKLLQVFWFVFRMLRKWGPKAWKLGKGIYDDLEAQRAESPQPLAPEEVAREFNRVAEQRLADLSRGRRIPTRPTLNAIREDVWKYKNQGKEPKRLDDARYRAMPPKRSSGKARRR